MPTLSKGGDEIFLGGFMKAKTKWEEAAANVIAFELHARGLNMNDLAKKLTESGTKISHNAIRLKIMRGAFSAAFLLQCLDVIGSGWPRSV